MQPSAVAHEENSLITLHRESPQGRSRCHHSPIYSTNQCWLCFFQEGYLSEIPRKIHMHHVLADNGNPQTDPALISHISVVMGLRAPCGGQDIREFRKWQRQVSVPAFGTFPITSTLRAILGTQPPLGVPLLMVVEGNSEAGIASKLEISRYNLAIRLVKAVRMGVRIYHDHTKEPSS